MSKPEPDASAPAPAAAPAPAPDGAGPEVAVTAEATAAVGPDPAAVGPDPAGVGPDADEGAAPAAATAPADRVELTKPAAAAVEEPVPPAGPVSAGPAPAGPDDPWAAPAPGATPSAPHTPSLPYAPPLAGQVPPPGRIPPPAATGWATVPPGALSGYQPGYAYPQEPGATNGFAVAALVTGLLCLWPLPLVFGIVALIQLHRRNERGRGMAVTGVVLGALGTLGLLVGLLGVVAAGVDATEDADRPARAPKAPPGGVVWSSLKAGDCYNLPGDHSGTGRGSGTADQSVLWVSRVPCLLPHQGEVAGTARIPESDGPGYPGEPRVRERAAALCGPVLDEYALDYWAVPDGMDEVYLYPSRANWKSGERDVTCAYEDRDGQHRGSVRTDRAALNPAQLAYLEAARAFNSAYWDEPDAEIDEAAPEYRTWARKMAEASRKEAEDLSRTSTNWPEGARPKVAELAAAQREAATAWDTAAKTTDGTALEREVRRARTLVAKSTRLTTEIRRELGLSTGEQVGDIQA
ncbi:DUF4190 domain-containing protein [Kitasatospora sp. A2-31]|uniref:DUF4190 domain-containing protein n=1 Tax=Kitasatospora sp. A2-31 TaxID=2916414 RepID=UPI001EEED935|nr:DUF4190 domain-containing protein [Kitasatospora sp. A2-31]MCG6499912.1 DUF4190 domain-containing protein [Kitasatospora sp. A2-31]